jgi:hypothetical protein
MLTEGNEKAFDSLLIAHCSWLFSWHETSKSGGYTLYKGRAPDILS